MKNNSQKMTPVRCGIRKIGNNFVGTCQDNKTCKMINNTLHCPGYDNYGNYGTLNDIGANPFFEEIMIEEEDNVMENTVHDNDFYVIPPNIKNNGLNNLDPNYQGN